MLHYDPETNTLCEQEAPVRPRGAPRNAGGPPPCSKGKKPRGYLPHDPREPAERTGRSMLRRTSKAWHVELATFLITNPSASHREIGDYFGVSPTWISSVINSDAFRDFLRQRQDEHFHNVSLALVDKVRGLADQGVTALAERVEKEGFKMPTETLQSVTDLALKSLGFGARSNGTAVPGAQVQVVVADREALVNARATMQAVREKVIDVELKTGDANADANANGPGIDYEVSTTSRI